MIIINCMISPLSKVQQSWCNHVNRLIQLLSLNHTINYIILFVSKRVFVGFSYQISFIWQTLIATGLFYAIYIYLFKPCESTLLRDAIGSVDSTHADKKNCISWFRIVDIWFSLSLYRQKFESSYQLMQLKNGPSCE